MVTYEINICNDELFFWTSYCLGDSFHRLLEVVYYLHPNNNEYTEIVETTKIKRLVKEYDGTKYKAIYEVPYKADFYWDEEGSVVEWSLSHKPTLKEEFQLNIKIKILRIREQPFKYTVSYKDFCCALSQAYTKLINKWVLLVLINHIGMVI